MLGYTETDIYKMMASINLLKEADGIPLNLREGLAMAYDLLDGLIAEGRI